jgi:lysozyme family protein
MIVIAYEGGFVCNAADPGGATKFGITLATLSTVRGKPCDQEDVRALTTADAAKIYADRYWPAAHGDDLAAGVDLIMFDAAVNQGPHGAAECLQAAVGVDVDGAIGPKTLAAAAAIAPGVLIEKVRRAREARYREDPDFVHFGHGWLNRLTGISKTAQAWAVKAAAAQGG